ncbi:Clavaminate synthase-like protein [Dichomitus squalens LYAD-421 SS1]|uniref:Clavaminate synthase-like protein n=2 Tax=Dichomitus squalens TaxID=114155 RepID=A0A4Q9PT17_9APHY|nr:Clavaminate synthase-like protein [Dichomitus squalens LYAD-421 SS1]EJF58298.1 Clavaminate synthase-like protein [Dichomitus squalens LYAD-421 SS1]TBU57602.1 Clavaminate synthase-like protein [Dichomitus squalens]
MLAGGSISTIPHLKAYLPRRLLSHTAIRQGQRENLLFNRHTYSWFWLRDSCQCPSCIHPTTRQKLHRTSDIPVNVKPVEANGLRLSKDGVHINWDSGHESFYSSEFLRRYASRESKTEYHRDVERVLWNVKKLKAAPNLYLPYDAVKTPAGLHTGLTQLIQYGLLFVTGVPTEKTSNEECELRALGERFGELRRTFYGETWDVKNIRNSRNIAYTNVDLGLHMDLLYFQHPPRYQILHCLRNRVEGGTSIFVDAVHVASELRLENKTAFYALAHNDVTFHYINDGHHLHHSHPTIQLSLSPSSSKSTSAYPKKPKKRRSIEFINYSPPFQAPLPLEVKPQEFVPALKKFADMLEDPAVRFEYLLKEGDAVIFDNRRVLHARTAFHEKEAESNEEETNRWLKGCYLEADAILDRRRVLNAQLEEAAKA